MRTILEIATDLGDGLEPWLTHDEDCVCVPDTVRNTYIDGDQKVKFRDAHTGVEVTR